MTDQSPAWRRLSEEELHALAPYTLNLSDLSDDAAERVRREYVRMLGRGVGRFLHHLGRLPDEREARLLAKACCAYLNAGVIPLVAERGRVTLQ